MSCIKTILCVFGTGHLSCDSKSMIEIGLCHDKAMQSLDRAAHTFESFLHKR